MDDVSSRWSVVRSPPDSDDGRDIEDNEVAATELHGPSLGEFTEHAVDGRTRCARHGGDVLLGEADAGGRRIGRRVERGQLGEPPGDPLVGGDVEGLDEQPGEPMDVADQYLGDEALDIRVGGPELVQLGPAELQRRRRLEGDDRSQAAGTRINQSELPEGVARSRVACAFPLVSLCAVVRPCPAASWEGLPIAIRASLIA